MDVKKYKIVDKTMFDVIMEDGNAQACMFTKDDDIAIEVEKNNLYITDSDGKRYLTIDRPSFHICNHFIEQI